MRHRIYTYFNRVSLITVLLAFFSTSILHAQTIYHVSKTGNDANDGLSWGNAFLTLQQAHATAGANSEIWVAQGTYHPDEGSGQTDNDRNASFTMKNDVGIYGGFVGTETMRSQRDFATNVTILSGDIDQNDNSGGDNSGNSYHVVLNSFNGLNNTAILDGFKISRGNASQGLDNNGGGMRNRGTSPTISNCQFINNTASNIGGSVLNSDNSFPTFNNCSFSQNSANFGGGMYNFSASPTLTNCSFNQNSASEGGGMYNSSASPTLTNCSFSQNSASDDGGGMYNSSASPTLTNCSFNQNSASDDGGGIFNSSASPTLTNCSFSQNSANLGGGIFNRSSSTSTLINCSFSQNSANFGGSAYNFFSSLQLTNCILWANSSEIFNDNLGNSVVSFSIVQGGYTGTGNKDQDPLFVDAANGDLRLQSCSPAIDMGDNSANSNSEDLNGNPRIFSGTIDIGAYEFQADNNILYVNQALTTGNNDGTSWANAFNNLQNALNAVSSSNPCETEIWVAQGTYYPDEGSGQTDNDRNASFVMKNNVGIYGGFDGTETMRYQRDFAANVTILSGDIDQNDGTSGNGGNSYHIIFNLNNGLNSTAILDGFTLTSGNANIGIVPGNKGGAIYNRSSSPTISNCIFIANEAWQGGAIQVEFASPYIFNCIFKANRAITSAGSGGAINNAFSSPTITNCLFIDNQAVDVGGAIRNSPAQSLPQIINCTFTRNSAPLGGAVYNFNSANPTIVNSILWNNSSEIVNGAGGNATVSFSIIQGGYAGTANKDQDPLFMDAANDDLRLQAASPAIDMGDNNASISTVDIDRNPRIRGCIIDMGAYELQVDRNNVLYVNQALTTGNNDGNSWADAYRNLQDALNDDCTTITEIWVAKGTYYPDEGNGLTNNDRDLSFALKNGVAIYGGFDGTESTRSERDFRTNQTILSGDIDQNDNTGGDNSGNSYNIIFNDNVSNPLDATAVLDGFTLTAGNADDANSPGGLNNSGAAMHLRSSSPSIQNCTFEANTAVGSGGAVYIFVSNPTFTNCSFFENSSFSGGGLFNEIGNPNFTNCAFSNNTASDLGGALFNSSADVTLLNCSFSANTATRFGGGIYSSSSTINITNCIFWGNTDDNGNLTEVQTDGNNAIFTNTIIRGGLPMFSTTDGGDNKDQDPFFLDADNNDLRLQVCSPAIDMGDNTANSASKDLDNSPRIFNSVIDIGAYEFQSNQVNANARLANTDQSVTLTQSITTDYLIDCDNLIAIVAQSGANPVSGDVTAYVFIDPSVQTFNGTPYVQRHYEINPAADASASTATVTLYFTQAEFDAFNAHPGSTLDLPTSPTDMLNVQNARITAFAGASVNNSGEPADYVFAPTTLIDPADNDIVWNAPLNRWEIIFEVNGFSGFFLQTENSVLPVELLRFTAEKVQNRTLLKWSTASELNNSGFEIERTSDPNSRWTNIGFAKGAGTTLEQQDYKFYDEQPLSGENYYRLKQMNNDGSFEYSNIEVVDFGKSFADKVKLYPNPTDGQLTLELPQEHDFEQILIYNSLGQLVKRLAVQNDLDLSDLTDEIYQLHLVAREGRQVQQLVKRR
ncbi:MAG: choice-of-anchor Q domain-containing protein [Bacteroidota bacterium]